MEFLSDYGLIGLFLASFLAATVLPFSSEALLTVLLAGGSDPLWCVAVASAGNWLGGMSSYGLGWLGRWDWLEKYWRIKRQAVEKWHDRLYRRGAIFAFFCWLPVVGDLFAVGLGFLRLDVRLVALFMLLGKTARYVVWAWLSGLVV